jgi:hypothetical protein
VGQGGEMVNIASVNMRDGHAGSRNPRAGDRSALSCLEAAVNITSFIICWVGPAAEGARRRDSGVFGAHCCIMVTTTFNTDEWSGAIGFGMSVRLAPGALYDRSFFRGASTAIFMLHKNWRS